MAMQAGQAPAEHEGVKDSYASASTTRSRSHNGQASSLNAGEGQEATRLDSHLSKHTYHGHRRNSFRTKDIDELTELRARRELPSLRRLAGLCKSYEPHQLAEARAVIRIAPYLSMQSGLSKVLISEQHSVWQSTRVLFSRYSLPHSRKVSGHCSS